MNNTGFIPALIQVEDEKDFFGNIRPFLFPFFVTSILITFLLYFLSIVSRHVIITSLFILVLLVSCVYAVSSINHKENYFDIFTVCLFLISGILLIIYLFFAKAKTRFIDYYIMISVFNGVFVVIRFFEEQFLNDAFKQVFNDFLENFSTYLFYSFMLVLFAYALLYKRYLNLPNKN
jgi:hypothetical protein